MSLKSSNKNRMSKTEMQDFIKIANEMLVFGNKSKNEENDKQ